ncbi:Uncharacterised protein [Segatella copri]|nr:Uncharacterised protein [Segatella copri]
MPIATSAQQATDRTPMYNCFFFMSTKVRLYYGNAAYIHLKNSKYYLRVTYLRVIFRNFVPNY